MVGAHSTDGRAAGYAHYTRWAILSVVVIGLLWTWISRPNTTSPTDAAASTRIGGTAPDFSLFTLQREKISLQSLKGKVVVLNFWATWCPPCRAEMAALQAAQNNLKDKGLVVLGMNQLEDPQLVEAFMQQ